MILSVFIWTFCSQANRVHRGRLGGGSKQSPKKPFSSAWLEKEPLWTPVNERSSAPLAQNNHYRRKLEERGRKEACEDDTRRNICISVQQLLFSLRKKPNTRYLLFTSGQAHTHTHTHTHTLTERELRFWLQIWVWSIWWIFLFVSSLSVH